MPWCWAVIVDNRVMMTKQHNTLLHGPKNRRPKWTQMISRCFFKHQGFGTRASCRMQMIITSVLWHHGQQLQSLIHVRYFIMWAQRILHVPNLWHAIQAMVNEVCDYRKPEIFLMHQQTRWHDWYVCLLVKCFSMRDATLSYKATDVMCVLLTPYHVYCYWKAKYKSHNNILPFLTSISFFPYCLDVLAFQTYAILTITVNHIFSTIMSVLLCSESLARKCLAQAVTYLNM